MVPDMLVEKYDVDDTSTYLALFLINSVDPELTGPDSDRFSKEVELRLMPLLENGVLGQSKSFGLPCSGTVHSRLTSSSVLLSRHG